MSFLSQYQQWQNIQELQNERFICGFCSTSVSSVKGYGIYSQSGGKIVGGVYICPNCDGPVFLSPQNKQYPTAPLGKPVTNVPKELNELYEEARKCTSSNSFTAAVLICRKMLMNIAVSQGAKEGLKFIEYVNYLSDNSYIPPNGKHWVDHIRKRGNEATHEISLMSLQDAKELIIFVEMLLRFIYEFPSMIPINP